MSWPKGIEQLDISLNLMGLRTASIAVILESSAVAVLEMLKGRLSGCFQKIAQSLQLPCMCGAMLS